MGDSLNVENVRASDYKGIDMLEKDLEQLQMAALLISKSNREGGQNDSLLIRKEGGPKSLAIVD